MPIVYKYRNYDLFMYKPDYDKDDDLVCLRDGSIMRRMQSYMSFPR